MSATSTKQVSHENDNLCIKDDSSHEEHQYLQLIERLMKQPLRMDRTKVGTHSLFAPDNLSFSLLNNTIPLLTTKRTFWRGIVIELLWIISGCTSAKVLDEQGINFWNANASREFLDNRGLTSYEEGDLGPVYGFQWRHFGAQYINSTTDYTGQGVDQLAECINLIRHDPTNRRIIMSSWNPADLHKMALPPCHMLCQFYVEGDYLDCRLDQRSGDMGLGVPFNIASYALLTHLIAHVCGKIARRFVLTLGDAHVYSNHVEPLKTQLTRQPYPFPHIVLDSSIRSIGDFRLEHVKLVNYKYHPSIQMDMAV